MLYLHGFASSPRSSKAAWFTARAREAGIPLACPDLKRRLRKPDDHAPDRSCRWRDRRVPDGPVVLVGSSLGAFVALFAAERRRAALRAARHPIDALVFLAPALDLAPGLVRHFGPAAMGSGARADGSTCSITARTARARSATASSPTPSATTRSPRATPPRPWCTRAPRRDRRCLDGGPLGEHEAARHPARGRRRSSASGEPGFDVGGHPPIPRPDLVTHRRSAGRAAALAIVAVGSLGGATHAPAGVRSRRGRPAASDGGSSSIDGTRLDTAGPRAGGACRAARLPDEAAGAGCLVESGAITPATRLQCPGSVVVGGRRIGCQHPRRAHRLSAAEAFALSCNVFFARASERLSRDVLNGVLASFGWPTVPAERTLRDGRDRDRRHRAIAGRASRRVSAGAPGSAGRVDAVTDAHEVREALAVAAREGTAAAFSARGVQALAKTGTSETMDGRSLGLVLAAWPADRPNRAAIVVVEGGSGPDAATIGAALARGERPVVTAPVRAAPLVLAPPAPSAAPADPPPAALAASGSPPPHPPIEGAGATVTIRVGTPQPRGATWSEGCPSKTT